MTPEQIANLPSTATRPRRTVPIVTDGDLREQIEALDAELDELESRPAGEGDKRLGQGKRVDPRAAEIRERLAELETQAQAATLHVVVQGLGGTEWRALLAAHPPRVDEQGKQLPADLRFGGNTDTIRQPAVRACILGYRVTEDSREVPPLPDETVDWLLGWASDAQMDVLWLASFAVCRGDADIPLPRARSTTQRSDGA